MCAEVLNSRLFPNVCDTHGSQRNAALGPKAAGIRERRAAHSGVSALAQRVLERVALHVLISCSLLSTRQSAWFLNALHTFENQRELNTWHNLSRRAQVDRLCPDKTQ